MEGILVLEEERRAKRAPVREKTKEKTPGLWFRVWG